MNEMLGKTTLECARFIVGQNDLIDSVIVRPYIYIPNKPSENNKRIEIGREFFLNGFDPNEILKTQPEGTNIALDSNLILRGGKEAYWPMADMAPEKTEENLLQIGERVREMLFPFTGTTYLLETKRSYHMLGTNILEDEKKWIDFLGTCLISSIVTKIADDVPNIHKLMIDYRYIGHSMLRGSTGLRLTAEGKKTVLPKVVAIVENETLE